MDLYIVSKMFFIEQVNNRMENDISINVRNLSFEYDSGNKILDNISISACGQENIGIIGANGVGKSTLLRLLIGLNSDFDGEIEIEGMPVVKKNLAKIREKMGYVFQDSESQLFMSNVYDEIAFAPRNYGLSEKETKKRVDDALNSIHIEYLRDRQIYKMSGGEKRMVSIATILGMKPDIILMDEPSIALDPVNRRNLINILKETKQLKLIASHDLDMVLEVCERVILMDDGRIVKDAPAKEILTDEELLLNAGLELPLCMQKPKWRES